MKKLAVLFLLLITLLNFIACSDSKNGSKSDPDAGPEKDDYSGTAASYLHFTLPDQKTYMDNGGTAADEKTELFDVYDPALVLTNILLNAGSSTYVDGYAATQFVDKNEVIEDTPDPELKLGSCDARKLYAYIFQSNNDGFDNRLKFGSNGFYNADLRWDQFNQFYLLDLNYSGKIHSPLTSVAGGTLPNMYNVSYAYDIYMFRKIDVKRPDTDGTIVSFEVGATTESYVDDTKYTEVSGLTTTKFNVTTITFTDDSTIYEDIKAISLDQFITSYIVAAGTASGYEYTIAALDNAYSQSDWTWAEMQQAYYLPDYDLICQVSDDKLISGSKIYHPERIEVEATGVSYDYSGQNPPAYAKYK